MSVCFAAITIPLFCLFFHFPYNCRDFDTLSLSLTLSSRFLHLTIPIFCFHSTHHPTKHYIQIWRGSLCHLNAQLYGTHHYPHSRMYRDNLCRSTTTLVRTKNGQPYPTCPRAQRTSTPCASSIRARVLGYLGSCGMRWKRGEGVLLWSWARDGG